MNSKFGNRKNCRKHFLVLASSLFFIIFLCGHSLLLAVEKEYPNAPIKVVVPYAPGGIVDLGARLTADYLSRELKVPVIIENRAGAGGMLGAATVLKAKPDGYTLMAAGDAPLVSGPLQSPNPSYNPFRDFLPMGLLGITPSAYGVYNSSPFKTITEFVKDAKDNPGKLGCGFPLAGSSNHLTLELFRKYAEIDIKLVPYKGAPDAISALLGKHIDMLVLTYVAFLPYAKSGEARILAVSDAVPGSTIKTLPESGFPQPRLRAFDGFLSFQAPVHTPKPVYEKLVLSLERVAKNPEFAAKLDTVGLIRSYKTPADFREFMKEKWLVNAEVLEQLGLKKWQGKID